jgi:uncharacterized protein YndB with AHSA1/START domain
VNKPVHASLVVRGASPKEVFAALLDVEAFPEWGFGLRRASVRGGLGLVPGARLEFVLSAVGLTHEVFSTIVVVESPVRISWRYTRGAVGSGGWTLEETGDGTRMTLSSDYEVEPAWLNTLANRPFFRGVAEDLLRRSMRRFVERLESQ